MSKQGNFQLIQQILSANDIVDVVSQYVALKKKGRNFWGLCPFHQEKTPSFSVSPEKQIFKCFGCGAGGDAIKFIQRMLNVTFPEAMEVLANRAGIEIERYRREKSTPNAPVSRVSKTDMYKANLWAAKTYSDFLQDEHKGVLARKYLNDRGLKDEICRKFLIGFADSSGLAIVERGKSFGFSMEVLKQAGLIRSRDNNQFSDMFRNRITFPIFDAIGNVVAFGARTLGDDTPKYLNTPETKIFVKHRHLFGLYQARQAIEQSNRIIVVEGYTDVLAAHQAGICNVVATLGTALTDEHIRILKRYADEIILIFDSDLAGQKAAERALTIFLTLGVDVKLASVPEGKDPCELIINEGKQAFLDTIASAVEALDYKWAQLEKRYELAKSSSKKRLAIDEFLSVIASCDPYGKIDIIQQGLVLGRLAQKLGVPSEELHLQMQKYRRLSPGRYRLADNNNTKQEQENVGIIPENLGQAAYKDILEVLICEPGYIASLQDILKPEEFEPDEFRQIAQALWESYDLLGEEMNLQDILAAVENPKLADIIIHLQKEGESKGNFAKTLEESVKCLQDYKRAEVAKQIEANLEKEGISEEQMDEQLQMLYEQLKNTVRRIPGSLTS